VIDPFIRSDHQIRNFAAFANIIDTSVGKVELKLTTSAEDTYQELDLKEKYQGLRESLTQQGVDFTFEFSPAIHDRSIKSDHGWCIYPGRGLDIFQKSSSKYAVSEVDQTKKKCRETDIIIIQSEGEK